MCDLAARVVGGEAAVVMALQVLRAGVAVRRSGMETAFGGTGVVLPGSASSRASRALIMRLPPYAALFVFALPTAIYVSVEAFWRLAACERAIRAATGLFISAKIASTALREAFHADASCVDADRVVRTRVQLVDALEGSPVRADFARRGCGAMGAWFKTRVRLELKQACERWRPTAIALCGAFAGLRA